MSDQLPPPKDANGIQSVEEATTNSLSVGGDLITGVIDTTDETLHVIQPSGAEPLILTPKGKPPPSEKVYSIQFGDAAIIAPLAAPGDLVIGPVDTTDELQQWVYIHGKLSPKSNQIEFARVDSSAAEAKVFLSADIYSWNINVNKGVGVINTFADPDLYWVIKKGKVTLGPAGSVLTFKEITNVSV